MGAIINLLWYAREDKVNDFENKDDYKGLSRAYPNLTVVQESLENAFPTSSF